jgi:hypothetical protein
MRQHSLKVSCGAWSLLLGAGLSGGIGCSAKPGPADAEPPLHLPEVRGESGTVCGRAVLVSHTDYTSTSISLLGLDGEVLRAPLISSASAPVQLSAPIGGDVVFPSQPATDLVLLDRYPNSVLTFITPETGTVRAQLDLGDGFVSNPHDYLELGDGRAIVSRYDREPQGAGETVGRGSDLALIRPEAGGFIEAVSLDSLLTAEELDAKFLPHPGQLLRLGDDLLIALSLHNRGFSDSLEARVGRISKLFGDETTELAQPDVALKVPGLKNCTALALSPSGRELALGCSDLLGAGTDDAPPGSAIVRLAVSGAGKDFAEISRIAASDLEFGPFGFQLVYASDDWLLVTTVGALEGPDAGRPDRLLALRLADSSTEPTVLVESDPEPFTLGGLVCMPACGQCFLADAGRQLVWHLHLSLQSEWQKPARITIDDGIGLPPRGLGLL